MKKLSVMLIVAFFAISTTSVNAQNKIGVRAGFQNSTLQKDGSMISGTDSYNSFYIGLFKTHKIIPAVHFGYGLEYMTTGAEWNDNAESVVLTNLSIPLYVEGKIGPVFALGGVATNFKINEKYSGIISDSPFGEENFNTVDFPAFLGAGFKILMFTLEARYHWGLTEINEGVKSQYLQLGVAVSF
jgi:hypothetical protein